MHLGVVPEGVSCPIHAMGVLTDRAHDDSEIQLGKDCAARVLLVPFLHILKNFHHPVPVAVTEEIARSSDEAAFDVNSRELVDAFEKVLLDSPM